MTEVKFLEIRDDGTHVPCMATRVTITEDNYQMLRAGWTPKSDPPIYLTNLNTCETRYNEFGWSNHRTMGNAHRCLYEGWESFQSGDVIDVEFYLGETVTQKTSENPRRDPKEIEI
jgi:hypothetical protein